MTEKRKPSYDLTAFKRVFNRADGVSITTSALQNAAALGLGRRGITEVIQTMEGRHFYKSMTSYANSRVWQDVYHVPSDLGVLYVKFTAGVLTEFLLLSFKGRDDG